MRAVLCLAFVLWQVPHGTGEDPRAVKVGDTIFLRVKLTGACITMEEENGEARHRYVHAQYWHHGLWQELKVLKDGSPDGTDVLSGDNILLRGHNGRWIESQGTQVLGLNTEPNPSQALTISKVHGEARDPIRIGDTVVLKGPSGHYLSVQGTELTTQRDAGASEEFVVDDHIQGQFDGKWTEEDFPGLEVFVIQGGALHFVDAIEFGIFPQGSNKFTTGLQGWLAHDAGELRNGKIMWTNGDVWIKTKGPFDGRWTSNTKPGELIFHIEGDTLEVLGGGARSKITQLSDDRFTTVEQQAPDREAELVGFRLHWGNGDIWVPLAAGKFDGRWTVKVNPGGDFFDIQGDMLFFDAGLESRILIDGDTFTTELEGATSHVKATLVDGELHWNNGDRWVRFHKDQLLDFWVELPTTTTATTKTATTITTTTATATTTTSTLSSTTTTLTTVTTTAELSTTTALEIQRNLGTTTTTQTGTPTTTTESLCLEDMVTYEPMDMDGVHPTYADNTTECRDRCRGTKGCTHFSYWNLATPGICHLNDIFSLKQVHRVGFVAGPPYCYENRDHRLDGKVKLEQEDVGATTFVPYAYRCLRMSRMYSPIMHSKFLTPELGYENGKQAVKGCRQMCMNHTGCFFYSIEFPARLCSLHPEDSVEMKPVFKHIAGQLNCSIEDAPKTLAELRAEEQQVQLFLATDWGTEDQDFRAEAPRRQQPRALGPQVAVGLAASLSLVALGVHGLRARAYRRSQEHSQRSASLPIRSSSWLSRSLSRLELEESPLVDEVE